jgi:hypothetical protein
MEPIFWQTLEFQREIERVSIASPSSNLLPLPKKERKENMFYKQNKTTPTKWAGVVCSVI